MSPRCDQLLAAWEAQEGSDGGQLEAHLADCARCRVEQAWLLTEQTLFAQRALRQALRVDSPRRARPPANATRWPRAMLPLAASLVLAVAAGLWSPRRALAPTLADWDEGPPVLWPRGAEPALRIASVEARFGACLMATPREDAPCQPRVPASFAASFAAAP